MAQTLRDLYGHLKDASTAQQAESCKQLLSGLTNGDSTNLATLFCDAMKQNLPFEQIDTPFIPDSRGDKDGTNPVTAVMKASSPLRLVLPPDEEYTFWFGEREVPHLRARTKLEEPRKGWIDYVARTSSKPIIGEVKWEDDETPFYAFVQALTYLSELATPNQIERATEHNLFGSELSSITEFDLHVFLANYNDRGTKGPLIDETRKLATAFKDTVESKYPSAFACLGRIICIWSQIEDERFTELSCKWVV